MIKILGELEAVSEHSAESLEFFGRGISDEAVELQRLSDNLEALKREAVDASFPPWGKPAPAPPKSANRSALVYSALRVIPSRFQLAAYAAKFARKVHRPGDDVAKTIRAALESVASEGEGGSL